MTRLKVRLKRDTTVLLFALLLVPAAGASAQLLGAKEGPVVYGHHHLSAANVDAAKKFWTEVIGGRIALVGTEKREVVAIPGALIFMTARAASGPSKGTTFDHIGLSVPNLRAVLDKAKAAGFRIVTATEAPPNVKVVDDIGVVDAGGVTGIGYIIGPDEVKIEFVEMKAQKEPVVNHHLHFFNEKPAEMQAWRPGRAAAQPDDDERAAAGTRDELLDRGHAGGGHAGPGGRSHRLRGARSRGVSEAARIPGREDRSALHQGRGPWYRHRVRHRPVGHVYRAHRGSG
jgi:predicted enzyme related to lactoylglutathione lyase